MGDDSTLSPIAKAIEAHKKRREELILDYKKKQAASQQASAAAKPKCGTCGQKRRGR